MMVAGYTSFVPAVDVSDKFSLGLRGEYFKFKQGSGDNSVTALTLSANLKAGGLTFIPEFRLDNSSNVIFETTMGSYKISISVCFSHGIQFNIFFYCQGLCWQFLMQELQ
jgi:hypothetical protein